jgi:uncharacterized protein (DUF849 family)
MDKIIIKACLNGARGREQNSNVPWTPTEIAAEAKRCFDAGASIVHIHARTPQGAISYDPAWYTEADRLIRAQTPLVVNHTTARMPDATIDQVLRYLHETPEPVDMVSLNTGNIVLNTPLVNGSRRSIAIPNSYDDIRQIILACRERASSEPAVLDTGFLTNVARWLKTDCFLFLGTRWSSSPVGLRMASRSRLNAAQLFFMTDCIKELFPRRFGPPTVLKTVCSPSAVSPLRPVPTSESALRTEQLLSMDHWRPVTRILSDGRCKWLAPTDENPPAH